MVLCVQTGLARDKTSPDSLRIHNAGTSTFISQISLPVLFANIVKAADSCYSLRTGTSSTAGVGGAIGGATSQLTSASDVIVAAMDADQQHGYVIVRAVGGMGWVKSNILQFDLTTINSDSTRLDVYRARKNKFYENAAVNAEAWSRGQFDVCKLDCYFQELHERKKKDGR